MADYAMSTRRTNPLKKHATTRDMQHAIARVNRSQVKAVVSALKTFYFMAKENLAIGDITYCLQKSCHVLLPCWLHLYMIQLHVPYFGGLTFGSSRGGREFTYEHSESVRGFQVLQCAYVHIHTINIIFIVHATSYLILAAVVDEELSQQLEIALFYSLLIGESTDIDTDHTLIMHVQFVHGGEVCMRFFDITELSATDILRKKLPLEKAYGSVIVGVCAGVRETIRYIVTTTIHQNIGAS